MSLQQDGKPGGTATSARGRPGHHETFEPTGVADPQGEADAAASPQAPPYWRTKTLEQLTRDEWESLCDGCGRCCLVKLEDDEGAVHLTRLACRLLDHSTCRCGDYANRHQVVDDCVAIDPAKVRALSWLPPTCGYRLVAEGRDLQWWHPLVSGDPDTVHQAGISVRGWATSETKAKPGTMHRYIINGFGD